MAWEVSRFRKPKFATIYLLNVCGTDVYKIGYTANPIRDRLWGIKYHLGDVKLVGTTYCGVENEKILHSRFNKQLVQNWPYKGHTECFHLSEADVSYVLDFFKEVEIPEPIMDRGHPQWKEFLSSISFWLRVGGRSCNHTFSYAQGSLSRHKYINPHKSIEFFKSLGCNCDCELLNMALKTA